jgi:two-component system, LytTR family, response regulator
MKLRALVVDDEPIARRMVTSLIGRDSDMEVVAECASGADAVAAIDRAQPHVVFLDIRMPECDGFEVLERLGPRLCAEVVFVTAYDAYAIQAFEAGALDYVLKPFDDERFLSTLRRIKARFAPGRPSTERRLFIKGTGQISLVPIADIDWIEAADYYACLRTAGRSHLIRRSLAQLEDELDPSWFCRIHRSTIVNLRRVRHVELTDDGEYDVVLDQGIRLRVSRRYREQLRERLEHYPER